MVRKAGKGVQKCDYGDIITPMVFGTYYEGKLKKKAEEHFGGWWNSREHFASWLMGKPKATSYSNIVDLFMWYMDKEKELSSLGR